MAYCVDREHPSSLPALIMSAPLTQEIAEYCEILPIDSLLPADSPRLQGEDIEHIQLFVQLTDKLPPILVHRKTMRVIDGMHRLKAAILRGERTIEAILYDGDDAEAFIMAVKANVQHGLPLSLSDRKAAAARIVCSSPHLSDRAIAEIAGLSAKTVGAIRWDTAAGQADVQQRLGRDGRVRPLSTVDGRRFASELITLNPESSFREIARMAGISPSTVRDVRDRLSRGEDPVPTRLRAGTNTERRTHERKLRDQIKNLQSTGGRGDVLDKLSRDPAIRMTERGRALLRWLNAQSQQVDKDWDSVASHVPEHCMCLIADFACSVAGAWLELADEMRRRSS